MFHNFFLLFEIFNESFTLSILFFEKPKNQKKVSPICILNEQLITLIQNFKLRDLQDSRTLLINLQDNSMLSCNLQENSFLLCILYDSNILSRNLQDRRWELPIVQFERWWFSIV